MAFPWLSEENFETGTLGHFDAENSSGATPTYAHYSTLARTPGLAMPWRGAYCMQIPIANVSTSMYVQETGDWDMTAGTNDIYLRMMIWVSPDIVMASTDEFAIMQFWSGTNTVECGAYINYTTANGYRLGIGKDTSAASAFLPLFLGQWNAVELFFDPAGSTASTLDFWVNGAQGTQLDTFTSANITSGVVGVLGQDAGTTAGTILFDSIITDDARIYPPASRFPTSQLLTKSGHLFVGPGRIDNVTMITGNATDNVVKVFDTDDGDTNDAGNVKSQLSNGVALESVDLPNLPVEIRRGAYISMSGTNPSALVQIGSAIGYGSDGAIRNYGSRRVQEG